LLLFTPRALDKPESAREQSARRKEENMRRTTLSLLAVLAAGAVPALAANAKDANAKDKIPITTSSEEARQLYVKARDLAEKLRATDAHSLYAEAVAKDNGFALAQLGLANTSGTAKEFFDGLDQAVSLSGKVSEPERLLISGVDAGAKGDVTRQRESFTKLVAAYPSDERAHNFLGGYYFGRQEYAKAVAEYQKAIAINPSFSQPYNQMGYAYRFLYKYPEAEKAFKKYIELIPGDPNPFDSYAELLMKEGRFEESIQNYEKALAIDKNFVASWVGIGNDRMFMGEGEKAREAFGRVAAIARNDGEKRLALFWSAMSYVHEGATDKAIAEIEKESAIAKAMGDGAALSGDWNQIGDILLEAGRADEALERYKDQVATMETASVPAEVKEATRRQHLFDLARVALAKKDIAGAKASAQAYATAVAAKRVPFEMWQQHELAGRIALEEKSYATAVAELERANQQDPRVMYLLAMALQGNGDAEKARTVATRAADFNGLSATYGFVRDKAKALTASKS
jgi:tetratricopeptide (TPR) repeat protein